MPRDELPGHGAGPALPAGAEPVQYPPELPRDVGDADLWLPTIDDCLRLVADLRDLGYYYEPREMSWLKRDLAGVVFGQFHLRHPDMDRLDMDLHVGPYSIRYCGLIRFTASGSGDPWTPLTDEDNLCAVIGNAAGDCVIDAKTMNDLVLATDRRGQHCPVVSRLLVRWLTECEQVLPGQSLGCQERCAARAP